MRFAAISITCKEEHVTSLTSDSTWVLIYSSLVTLLMLSWAYVPA